MLVAEHGAANFLALLSSSEKEPEERRGERSWPFQIREMRRGQHDMLRAGNSLGEKITVSFPWSGDVAVTADHQRGDANLSEQINLIQVSDRRAASGIARWIRREENAP